MKIADLRQFDLVYLGSPYSKYPDGIEAAFREACGFAARLLRLGIKIYSPIAHTHPIAIYGNVDPFDHDIWLPFDEAIMAKSDAMLVATMPGWDTSRGVLHEIGVFRSAGKPVFYLPPSLFDVVEEAKVEQ